jgi:ribosomal protein L11 methyltransferase
VEPVSAALLAAGCAGVEIQDPSATSSDPFAIDRKLSPEELAAPCTFFGYLPVTDTVEPALNLLRERLAALRAMGIEVEEGITLRLVEDEEWADAWKAFYKPMRVGEHFVVKPTWEAWDVRPGDRILGIDPGMAFGTGLHPSTRMCLEILDGLDAPLERALDWGTGSGILSLAACLVGASHVVAIDLDPVAVSVAAGNLEASGFASRCTVLQASIEDLPPGPPFDLVMANIVADPIIAGCGELRARLAPRGLALVAGVVDHRQAEVEAAFAAAGLCVLETRSSAEWRAFLLRREWAHCGPLVARAFGQGGT